MCHIDIKPLLLLFRHGRHWLFDWTTPPLSLSLLKKYQKINLPSIFILISYPYYSLLLTIFSLSQLSTYKFPHLLIICDSNTVSFFLSPWALSKIVLSYHPFVPFYHCHHIHERERESTYLQIHPCTQHTHHQILHNIHIHNNNNISFHVKIVNEWS